MAFCSRQWTINASWGLELCNQSINRLIYALCRSAVAPQDAVAASTPSGIAAETAHVPPAIA